MSIKGDLAELESIRRELKSLSQRRKQLREREKLTEDRIQQYIRSKGQPGLKYNGVAVLLEDKEKRKSKKPKDRDKDATEVLERYGIRDAENVLKELLDARKGSPEPVSKLKIKKYKH